MLPLLSLALSAAPLPESQLPNPLKSWVPWAMHGHEEVQCPSVYHSQDSRFCVFVGRIDLALRRDGGSFSQSLLAYRADWQALPGGQKFWPQSVKIDGKPAVVVAKDGLPGVELSPGAHQISGEFAWKDMPESLPLPARVGLIGLSLDGARIAEPEMEADGQLWLRKSGNAVGESHVDLKVHRKINDDIPLLLTTHIEINAAGKNREMNLPAALLPGFTALSLNSPLPARVEADGSLRVQVRAGSWHLYLTGRSSGPLNALPLPKSDTPLAAEEVWSYEAQPSLRLATVEGVLAIDPQQAGVPEDWKRLPAYRLQPGDTLKFNQTKRGDPTPAPDQLSLSRQLWLDFDGGAYTVQDAISGTISQSWRLEMAAPQQLGHVSVDGSDQLLTRLAGSERVGVEIRQGKANLLAESRVPASGKLPATGWAQSFNKLDASLHLPPGWRLLHASGVDRAPGSWVESWSLFDFFIVLMVTLATGKLFGWRWGALALAGLALSYHEPAAPRLAWINLLALVAILRVLPQGRFSKWLRAYWGLSLVSMVLILLPFAITQIRQTLYPVLEPHNGGLDAAYGGTARMKMPVKTAVIEEARPEPPVAAAPAAPAAMVAGEVAVREEVANVADAAPKPAEASVGASVALKLKVAPQQQNNMAQAKVAQTFNQFDPNARVQTGPGLPRWQWSSYALHWSGPVEQDQQLRLWLISPAMNALLTVLRLAGLAALLMLITGWRPRRWPDLRAGGGALAAAVLALMLLPGQPVKADELPDEQLLESLRGKLYPPAACLPSCAQYSHLAVSIAGDSLQLRLEAHAAIATAVPLPGGAKQWLPAQVQLDGKPASGLLRESDGTLWLALPAGIHQISMESSLAGRDAVQLALPLKPHQVVSTLSDWTLEGLGADGQAGESLILARKTHDEKNGKADQLPPFVRVERSLSLGLTWEVVSTVSRVGESQAPLVVDIPLLPGEAVTSEDIKVENGHALINLGRSGSVSFNSVLKIAPELKLQASSAGNQVQVWSLAVGPQWHASFSGIAVVQHQDGGSHWLPQWRPWPGESVTISLSKPAAVAGPTLTLEQSQLTLSPGIRASDAQLELTLRSSQGGQHSVTLPEGASLQRVLIGGAEQPIRQEGRTVKLPLVPGEQQIVLQWREPRGMGLVFTTSPLDVGISGANANLQIKLPADRWVLLLGGPAMGPAVLFWGVLLVLLLVSIGLGRLSLTPLRGLHWFGLGLGLMPVATDLTAVVFGWLLLLGVRRRFGAAIPQRWAFNLLQIVLVLLSLAAMSALFDAVQQGLLGHPDMQVQGHLSSSEQLSWYQDHSQALLPSAWVLSLPLLVYRLLMLVWASWLAWSLLNWLKWGWSSYSEGGLWRKAPPKAAKAAERTAASASGNTEAVEGASDTSTPDEPGEAGSSPNGANPTSGAN